MYTDNHIKIHISGSKLQQLDQEAGTHRVQRVPPTEKRGRVHTSSVTVAIIDPQIKTSDKFSKISDDDFRIEWFSGTGKGGQHRNKKMNSCRVIHIPTNTSEARQGRKRETNLRDAKAAIIKRLEIEAANQHTQNIATMRNNQIGSGSRGDKIRTYRLQDDMVIDHRTSKKVKYKQVMRGRFDKLWS